MGSDKEGIRKKIAGPVIQEAGIDAAIFFIAAPGRVGSTRVLRLRGEDHRGLVLPKPVAPKCRVPYFLLLDAIEGNPFMVKRNGRAGPAIHGGDPAIDGSLRATEACLRMSNDVVTVRGNLVKPNDECVCIDSETT
jgi:hypothetical protein